MNQPALNEHAFARAVCSRLSQGAGQLDFRTSERLAAARHRALALAAARASGRTGPEASAKAILRQARLRPRTPTLSDLSSRGWWRLGLAAMPVVMVVAGFVLADRVAHDNSVEEVAEIDSAILASDLPVTAWADRGLGVYMVNTRYDAAN